METHERTHAALPRPRVQTLVSSPGERVPTRFPDIPVRRFEGAGSGWRVFGSMNSQKDWPAKPAQALIGPKLTPGLAVIGQCRGWLAVHNWCVYKNFAEKSE